MTRAERRERAQRIVADLNDSSDECLMALDDLLILDLEDALAALVWSCTPTRIPSDVGYPGVKAPDKRVLETARRLLP
jgi:hypothetical protein